MAHHSIKERLNFKVGVNLFAFSTAHLIFICALNTTMYKGNQGRAGTYVQFPKRLKFNWTPSSAKSVRNSGCL